MKARGPGTAWRVGAVYLLLTILAVGLLAFDCGFWLDEAATLAAVAVHPGGLLARLVHPLVSPTRLFLGTPYALALASGAPLLVLQLAGVLSWLLVGVGAQGLARRLFPASGVLPYAAGALTLCASSDFLTGSIIAVGYDTSAFTFLAALVLLFRFQERPRPAELLAACLLLCASLFTTDAAAPAALLAPGLLVLRDGLPVRRRTALAAAAWWGAMLPWAVLFLRAFTTPGQYVSSAFLPLPAAVKALRLGKLFLYNFTPWIWAFRRRNWFPSPAPALSLALRLALGLVGLVAFLWGLRAFRAEKTETAETGAPARRGWLAMTAACLLLALVSNAAFAFLRFADVCFRTHLLSRVFASLAVAAAAWGVAAARPRLRPLALAVPALFVGLGVVGGLERQDYFFGYTRRHRVELRSILAEAPGFLPGSGLILRVPPGTPPIRATHVGYLAESWMALLYGEARPAVFLWDEENGSRCRAGGEAFVCTGPEGGAPVTFPTDRLVVMSYEKETSRFRLDETLPGPGGARYRPRARIVPAAIRPLARDLLERRTPLTSLLR